MHHEGYYYNDIAKETDFNKGFISKLIKRFLEHGDVLYDERISNHRPEALSERDKELIKEELHNNCYITSKSLSKKVQETFHHYVCLATVYNYEMKIGSFRHPDVVPLLTEEKKASRVEFAKCHLNDRFSNVLFSDESYFPLFRQTKKVFAFADEEPPRIKNPDPHAGVMF